MQSLQEIRDQQKILKGTGIYLEPFQEKHLSEDYVSWLNDPEVCRFSRHGESVYTMEKAKEYFQGVRQSPNAFVFAIMDEVTNEHLGNSAIYIDAKNQSGNVSILLGRKQWGRGVGTETYRILIDWAFHELSLHRLISGMVSANRGMTKIMEKVGFKKEGVFSQSFFKNGQFWDLEQWALLNPQHQNQIETVLDTRKPDYGKPLYHDKLQYCVRCCMPETNEGIKFDEMGICQACYSQEQKMHIDWKSREVELRKILQEYKSKAGENYDCIVPISGGKDSCFQLHILTKVYGMKPLAVTFNHNWYTETGKYNLWNILEKLNIDHLMFTPNRGLIGKLAKQSLYKIGDSCWHCHMGVGAFPLQAAVKFNIPLLVWGESIADTSGRANYYNLVKFDRDYFLKVSAKVPPQGMTNQDISAKDVYPFNNPSVEDMERVGVVGIHLGDYIFWDHERQVEFLRKEYDWREDKVEGTYKKYKSVECRMSGVHDYAKFIKRGFGRGTDHASQDLRAGLLTREEAFELAKKYDAERPEQLDYYLKITGFSEKEFEAILKAKRADKAKDL